MHETKKHLKKFNKLWELYYPSISSRENYKTYHDAQLKILINLLIEYQELSEFIQEKGYSYKTVVKGEVVYKPYVEVGVRNRTITQIREYSKLLDIKLTKDTTVPEDSDDWN